jgi:ribosomal-protein-alanine N-acetyltransferase
MEEGKTLSTSRLELVPATAALARAEIEQRDTFSQLLGGAMIPENWPPELMADHLLYFLHRLGRDPELAGWLSWYWVLRGDTSKEPALVGCGGFGGRPQPDGTIVVGYSVLPQYQGCGYATEAVAGLLSWAFAHRKVSRVIAETFPELKPSLRVLEKLGFHYIGRGVFEPGAIRFELSRENYRLWREKQDG